MVDCVAYNLVKLKLMRVKSDFSILQHSGYKLGRDCNF